MKLSLCVLFASIVLSFDVFSQDISYSGYLNENITVSIDAGSIQDAVRSVVEQSKSKFPDLARVTFVFEGPVRPMDQKRLTTNIENKSLENVLRMLRLAFNQTLEYDFTRNVVKFTTVVSTGDDPSRKYYIDSVVSANLGINWESEFKLIASLQRIGVVADFSKIDLSKRVFVASSNIANLQHIDMLIYIGKRSM